MIDDNFNERDREKEMIGDVRNSNYCNT